MEKAGDIIKDAFYEITLLGAEAPVEAVDAQSGIRYLNRMMAAFDAEGIDLGYTEVTGFASDITTPAGASEGMVAQLAVRLWDQFSDGQPVPSTLLARAIRGKETMRILAVTVGATEYPSTLPVGSGNEGDSTDSTRHFYPDLQDELLAESTGSIGLEESTE